MKCFFALIALLLAASMGQTAFAVEATRILIVVGPTNHPPGTHEVAAGGRLVKHCLENMANVTPLATSLLPPEMPKPETVHGVLNASILDVASLS